ncbi:TetR family transcriptional regulator C-terminal domain-containing protein [Undibacterium sp. TJN25]|uniref:TetR/AcrR family transcriptional regulator n=1 Tax=Undibacterium sp. TJN25 TaxID=3413056 RepID=UPI003BF31B3F
MAKPSHREKILTEGLRVVHQHGFGGASVRDIVQAAGVPQGSFTNHFGSKESFGLEIIDLYFSNSQQVMSETLLNDALPPLQRLSDYMDRNRAHLSRDNMRNGCLYGNFTAEASDHSEPIRKRLIEIFAEVRSALTYCLQAAVKAGELPTDFDCEEIAGFILSSLQGANLMAKGHRDAEPVDRFKRVLFSQIFHRPSFK